MLDRDDKEIIQPAGCLGGTILGLIITLMLIVMLFGACSAPIHALQPEGQALQLEQNRAEVSFPDAIREGNQAAAWFYFPGVGKVDTALYHFVLRIEKKP